MTRRSLLSDEELALWAQVAASVTPLPGRKPVVLHHVVKPPESPPPPPPPTSAAGGSGPVRPALKPLAPLERRMRRRVERGAAPIDGIIDLHGMRQDEAHRRLLEFIRRKHQDGASLVIVVTGKGAPEGDRGVLRRLAPHWLADPGMRGFVLGFEEASRRHGGAGALYVRLRRRRTEA